ncbi:MAG: class I SAM-dependent methyltransferase, partial [Bacteroidota bacterium]
MNKAVLKNEVQEFVLDNLSVDIPSLLLKKPFFKEVSNKELAQQIASKKKAKTKLPTWFKNNWVYYPDKLNLEQSSSEITAKYKANLVEGKSLIDLTGGFGVDSYFFSQRTDEVYHCEVNPELSEIALHNFEVLGRKNIIPVLGNGLEFLRRTTQHFNWVFIDPSRRHGTKGKVFFLKDSVPDVTQHLTLLFSKTNRVLLKTSPLLDISSGIRDLTNVKEIHVVAVGNEVKELLWVLQSGFKGDIAIKTLNFGKFQVDNFDFNLYEEKEQKPNFSIPRNYIYEPNAAILKSGAFALVANRYDLYKLHEHTHLYTSDRSISFPGRRFCLKQSFPYSKKIKKMLGLQKANLATRNFPETVASLRQKFTIADGGEHYLFFTRDLYSKRIVLLCKKE